ncbi:hypothetical protein MBLNU459_g2959t1 [Dothideomycetes sp. NU459]
MDTLEGSSWDVLIVGTGIQQSLLALSLSRSTKKVLHIDRNDLYGGAEAALSLQEAEQWAERVNSASWRSPFSNASVTRSSNGDVASKLSASRASAYNLSLAPSLLYTRSALLSTLVSSRVHEQLEFQPVGSWFICSSGSRGSDPTTGDSSQLVRVPNGREDIFADESLNLRAKGSLMKFIRFVVNYEEKPELWEAHRDMPFSDFLSTQFNLPPASHAPLMALGMGSLEPERTLTSFVLPRIARHLRSMGLFGPGFSALVPRWGGLSEIAQVGCRAGAVGGAVYVLGKGIATVESAPMLEDADVEEIPRKPSQSEIAEDISDQVSKDFVETDEASLRKLESSIQDQSLDELLAAAGYSIDAPETETKSAVVAAQASSGQDTEIPQRKLSVRLEGGETVKVDYVVGCVDDLPNALPATLVGTSSSLSGQQPISMSRRICIVSSPLGAIYPTVVEGGTKPVGAVVVFPSGSLTGTGDTPQNASGPPVHVIAHTNDTGECPQGQSIIYASTTATGHRGTTLLDQAIKSLLSTQATGAEVIWALHYEQHLNIAEASHAAEQGNQIKDRVLCFPDPSLDIVFDDAVLDNVKDAWTRIMGDDADGFMMFQEREGAGEEDHDDDF